jgi:two-component system response regulator HupR/HoxA
MAAPARPGILVVDDEPRSVEVIARVLDEDFDVHTALSASEAIRILETKWIQMVFSDQRMPETSGVEFLTQVRERWPDIVRIVITGYIDPEDIISATNKAGVYQFVTKPWHPDHLLLTARNAARLFQLQREHDRLSGELKLLSPVAESRVAARLERVRQHYHFDSMVRAPGSPVDEVCRRASQVAAFNVPVLVLGETGTGKELLARAVHYGSPRSGQPFYSENCGAIPDELLESELFGHRKGAFTGAHANRIGLLEQADGGTVFLDEIGDVSPAFQVKLLRFLQEGHIRPVGSNETKTVNVRVIAATHRDLRAEVRAGRFREDLYYRLSTMTLTMPPLRERPGDIAVLAPYLGSCTRGGYACINCTAPGFEEPGHPFQQTPKFAGIPVGLPTDMPKAWFVALASLAKAATPERVRRNAAADRIVVPPSVRNTSKR